MSDTYSQRAAKAQRRLGRPLRATEQSKLQRAVEHESGAEAAPAEAVEAAERLARTRRARVRAEALGAWLADRAADLPPPE